MTIKGRLYSWKAEVKFRDEAKRFLDATLVEFERGVKEGRDEVIRMPRRRLGTRHPSDNRPFSASFLMLSPRIFRGIIKDFVSIWFSLLCRYKFVRQLSSRF